MPIYILLAYAKAVGTDPGPKQKQQVRKLITLLKEQHGVKGQPDATAAAYLSVIERLPAETQAALKN